MNPFAHFEDQFGHLQLSDNDAALHVFLAGWNSAMMEMMQRVNKMPFGDDTRASFAVYFQSQMVNVDAIEKPAQQDSTCNKTLLAQGKAYPRTCKKCDLGPCIGEPVKPAQQTIHCKHRRENNGVCPHHNLQCGWPKCNEPEQPAQQEPVAWAMYLRGRLESFWLDKGDAYDFEFTPDHQWKPLYTSPPADRKPLTDEEIYKIANDLFYGNGPCDTLAMCRAIEAAHGIKENT